MIDSTRKGGGGRKDSLFGWLKASFRTAVICHSEAGSPAEESYCLVGLELIIPVQRRGRPAGNCLGNEKYIQTPESQIIIILFPDLRSV